MIEIAHQRRTREPAGHLPRRAAHIDIDDVRAKIFRDFGRFAIQWASRPASWIASGEIRPAPAARRSMSGRALTSSSLATISDTTKSGAMAMRQNAKWAIRNTRHWSEENRIGKMQLADAYAHILGKPSI